MKKLTKKQTLSLRSETIKRLNPQDLVAVGGGRWYESWSLCDGGGGYDTMSCAYWCGSGARG